MPNEKFKADDLNDISIINDGLDSIMKRMVDCAKLGLPALSGPEKKKEMNKARKKYYQLATYLVKERLKGNMMSDLVQGVYDGLDMETVACSEEVDDDTFFRLLDEFAETATMEVEKQAEEKITMEEIDSDEQYQNCLEVLHQFVEQNAEQVDGTDQNEDFKTGSPVHHSEGFEALTEFIPTCDPIFKTLLKNPYVSRKCRHVFDYETIPWLFKSGKVRRCPYPGCRVNVKKNDFFRDEELAAKIADKIRDTEMVYELD